MRLDRLASRRGAMRSINALQVGCSQFRRVSRTFPFRFPDGFSLIAVSTNSIRSVKFPSPVDNRNRSARVEHRQNKVFFFRSSYIFFLIGGVLNFAASWSPDCFELAGMKSRTVLRSLAAASCRYQTGVLLRRQGIRWASDTWSSGPAQKAGADS